MIFLWCAEAALSLAQDTDWSASCTWMIDWARKEQILDASCHMFRLVCGMHANSFIVWCSLCIHLEGGSRSQVLINLVGSSLASELVSQGQTPWKQSCPHWEPIQNLIQVHSHKLLCAVWKVSTYVSKEQKASAPRISAEWKYGITGKPTIKAFWEVWFPDEWPLKLPKDERDGDCLIRCPDQIQWHLDIQQFNYTQSTSAARLGKEAGIYFSQLFLKLALQLVCSHFRCHFRFGSAWPLISACFQLLYEAPGQGPTRCPQRLPHHSWTSLDCLWYCTRLSSLDPEASATISISEISTKLRKIYDEHQDLEVSI